ncbi:MAG: class I SAM-dependent methyltransferase [Flavobacteriaceae bacterium]|nr:class I SAM-dependent methyltransferase [Flavobacteriaceae bacterium]
MNQTKDDFLKESLINPITKEHVKHINEHEVLFMCSNSYPTSNNIPIIIDETESIFNINDIISKKPTAQDSNYRRKSLKNSIRQNLLPSLSKDFTLTKRYEKLAQTHINGKILIIGAGDKIEWYKSVFGQKSLLITSDIHSQFKPDIVFDSHQIPFANESFDLVIAGQVLEHTFKPWEVAKEIERVVKTSGNILIEVPFNFPYHSPPYDFFRFTFTGLRSLFTKCSLKEYEVAEGKASTIAVFNSQFLIESFSSRIIRMLMLFIGRILFGWIKYLDLLNKKTTIRSIAMPKGFSMIFQKDNIKRKNNDLLSDFFLLKNKS